MLVRDRQRIRARAFSGGGGPIVFTAEYLVIAGGGSGGGYLGGGGGAGGYRSSVTSESSGGGASAESSLSMALGTPYTVTVGAGGAGATTGVPGYNGGNSVFASIVSTGGGRGGSNTGGGSYPYKSGDVGGSGGGSTQATVGGLGTAGQGFAGGAQLVWASDFGTGGGGGASAAGTDGSNVVVGNGGDGVQSLVTGSAVYRAGGGGGSSSSGALGAGSGGLGGGGTGGNNTLGTSGGTNTGGGGGGTGTIADASATGGSGVVILRVPDTITATFTPGVTHTLHTPAGFNVYEITAAGASDTVTFNTGVVWTPAQLTGLALWLDAADSSTITLNGSDVSQWDDKSGNGRHASQATASSQPTYLATGFNGKPTLQTDGSDSMELGVTSLGRNVGGITCALVGLHSTPAFIANPTEIYISASTSTGTTRFATTPNPSTSTANRYGIAGRRLDSDSFATASSTTDSLANRGNPWIRVAQRAYSDGVANHWTDGTQDMTNEVVTGQTAGNTSDTDSLRGALFDGITPLPTGAQLSEIVLTHSTMTNEDRQKLEGYLAWKWGGI